MQWWRLVGAIGRFMMRAGVVILLFVVYQLWGTGLSTARAQDRLTRQFDRLVDESGSVATEGSSTTPIPTPSTGTASTDLAAPEPGAPIGRITIPTIDSDFIFLQGVDLKWLKDGPGHFPQTPLPGQPGNAAMAGHRTTYRAPFNRLDELKPGDAIDITTVQGQFRYIVDPQVTSSGDVRGHFIVGPNEISVLDQLPGNRLTLIACNPKFSAAQRIVVTATLESPPARLTPIPAAVAGAVTTDASIDALASGDPDAWPGSLVWGAAMALAWFDVWYAAHRWRRIPAWKAYLIGTPFVLLAMFVFFESVARLLPSSY